MHDQIIVVPEENINHCPRGLGYLFFESMEKFKNNIAQIDEINGYEDSYSQLLQRCIRASLELKYRGVTRGDIISINSNNHLESSVPFIAAQFLGCRVASLDPSIPLEDARYLLEQVHPRIIFTISSCEEIMSEAIDSLPKKPEIIVFGTEGYDEFIAPKDEEYKFKVIKVDPMDTAAIMFSSGTTGYPKGICCTHLMLAKAGHSYMHSLDNRRIVNYSTLYWLSAVMILIFSCKHGNTRLLLAKFDPREFWTIVEKYHLTSFYGAPTQIVQILKNIPQKKVNMESLTGIVIGGGPVPTEYTCMMSKMYPNITSQGWGQTELGIVTRFNHADSKQMELLQMNPSSCGMILPGYSAKIVDPESNKILGANVVGEIRIKSIYQMNGYHNKDSSGIWDEQGFICTGDLGYFNESKCLFIVDRLKEMFKYKSWHVTPVKIESILLKHPDISDAVVIGKPHDVDGDHPLALVVLNPQNLTSVTAEELQKYADQQLDDTHKLRGGVIFVNKLIYTPSGKLKRAEMRRLILGGNKRF